MPTMKTKMVLVVRDAGSSFSLSAGGMPNVPCEITTVEGYDAAVEAFTKTHYHAVVCAMKDIRMQLDILGKAREKDYWIQTIALASDSLEAYLASMAGQQFCFHIAGGAQDVPVALEKMFSGSIFGIDRYIGNQSKTLEIGIRDSQDKAKCLIPLIHFIEVFNKDQRVVNAVSDIADELIMNAIYDAPCDENGEYLYNSMARNERVVLPEDQAATLRCVCDGRWLVISMTDAFGSLHKSKLLNHLIRCVTSTDSQVQIRPGGSGVGLYKIILSYLTSFIVNVQPRKKSEVICIVDLRLSMRDFQRQYKSFHIFETESTIEISPDLSAVKEDIKDTLSIVFAGVIDENALFARIFETDLPKIRVDVQGVKRINSCGVREWVNAVKEIPADKHLEIIRCSLAMVKQFNMITNFGGRGKVVSFMAPYFCPHCNRRTERLIVIADHLKELLSFAAPRFTCDDCSQPLEFDDLEDRYFQFIQRQESSS